MALSLSQRLGLTLWGASTDPYNLAQRQASHQALDDLVAIDRQGPHNDRPAANAPGMRGVYWTSTDTANAGVTFRSDGTAWVPVNGVRSLILPMHFRSEGQFVAVSSPGSEGGYFRQQIVTPPQLGGAAPVLVGAMHSLENLPGATATFRVQRRQTSAAATDLAEWPELTATAAVNTYDPNDAGDVQLGIGDRLGIRVTAVTGSPTSLAVALLLRYQL